jgi:hypothetical protein
MAILLATSNALAQDEESPSSGVEVAPPPSGRDFKLKVPKGVTPKHGKYRKLMTRNDDGQQQVVRLLSRVEDQLVVIRPTGELSVVNRSDVQPTDKSFGKVTKKDLQATLAKTGLKGFKVVAAKPYLFIYGCSEAYYMHTRSILETMYPGVLQQLRDWGLKAPDPEIPLMVVIMPSRQSFDKLKKMPGEVLAYYSGLSNQVVLYEDQRFADAAPELALKQAAYTIAHEGVHQLLANTNIQQRLSDWPMWISEGLPEYFCPLSISSKVVKTGSAELPERTLKWTKAGKVNDLRMFSLLGRTGNNVIRTAVMADDLTADGYAISWGLVHYLVRFQSENFKNYLMEVSQIPPLNAYSDDPNAYKRLFKKHFGEDFAELEIKVKKHLNSPRMQKEYTDPVANQTRYFMKRVVKRGRAFNVGIMITTSPASARRWKELEEARHPTAKFSTKVCKSQREAEYEVQKFNRLGR